MDQTDYYVHMHRLSQPPNDQIIILTQMVSI